MCMNFSEVKYIWLAEHWLHRRLFRLGGFPTGEGYMEQLNCSEPEARCDLESHHLVLPDGASGRHN